MNENFEQLVSRALSGDRQAMAGLYTATNRQVYFTIFKLVGNEEDAQDLASDTYLTVFQNLHRLAEPRAFAAWVRMIAVNHAKDFLKKKKPMLFSQSEEEARVLGAIPEESEDCLPEVFVQREDLRRQVVELIDALPEVQKTTVYLHYMEGRSVEEVAEIMEVNGNTVKSRLNYARSKLRKLAEKSGVTLGAVSVITLILQEECKAAAVPAALDTAVTGIITSVAGAASAAAAANVGAGAVAAKGGLAAKIVSLSIGTKIAAAAVAGSVLLGSGLAVSFLTASPYSGFKKAVEKHGGLDSFIGMTCDEIKDVLGDKFEGNHGDHQLGYYIDGAIGFAFMEEKDEGTPCVEVYSMSDVVSVLDIHGYDYDDAIDFIEDNGWDWTENEAKDGIFEMVDDEAEFILYAYDGDLRYTILSDEDGKVKFTGIIDIELYKELLGYDPAEPDNGPVIEEPVWSEEDDETPEDLPTEEEPVEEEPQPEPTLTNDEVRAILMDYYNTHAAGAAGYYFVDLTGDGLDELINHNVLDGCGYFSVHGLYEGKVLTYGEFENGPTTGNMIGYYLYEEGGKTYILEDNFYMREGQGAVYYSIFSFTNEGAKVELRSESYEGDMLAGQGAKTAEEISGKIASLEKRSLGIWYYTPDLTSDIR